nr:hypothetical protein [Pimelobacter simplex]
MGVVHDDHELPAAVDVVVHLDGAGVDVDHPVVRDAALGELRPLAEQVLAAGRAGQHLSHDERHLGGRPVVRLGLEDRDVGYPLAVAGQLDRRRLDHVAVGPRGLDGIGETPGGLLVRPGGRAGHHHHPVDPLVARAFGECEVVLVGHRDALERFHAFLSEQSSGHIDFLP